LNNWTPRDLDVLLSFLGEGVYEAEIFSDGINSDRDGTDYKREILSVEKTSSLHLHLGAGGGWAGIIRKK
jgi:alpha-glucosidase